MHSYIQFYLRSHTHDELVTGSITLLYSFLFGIVGSLLFIFYNVWNDPLEHKTIDATEIADQNNTDAFQLHIRAMNESVLESDFLENLDKFALYLRSMNHPNQLDVSDIYDVLINSKEYDPDLLYYAELWIRVATSYWMIKPGDEMLPTAQFCISSSHVADTPQESTQDIK